MNTTITSEIKPEANIIYKEYDKYILLFGSLLSMYTNKNLNPTNFVITLIEHDEFQDLFLKTLGTPSLYDLLLVIFNRYPQLCNSKTISNCLRKNAYRINKKHI